MRVGILHPQSLYNLPEGQIWSGRIRARWLWENWPEAEPYARGTSYDAVIFTPHCASACAAVRGKPLRILDVCNPDWEGRSPFQRALRMCDAVTCSSPRIFEHVKTMTRRPVEYFPDRLDLSRYPVRKSHSGRAETAVWFGYAIGQETLVPMVPEVLERGLKLTLISQKFRRELFGIHADAIDFKAYHHATFEETLLECADIALNPRLEHGRFQYKSNNRTLTAWALGIPVAANASDLDRFLSGEARNSEAAIRLEELRQHWDIRSTVESYRELILKLQAGKK